MKPSTEPLNPFYMILLVVSVLFVATALAYGLLPELEQWSNQPAPQTAWRQAIRDHAWWWLLVQLAVMMIVAFASMALDRLRTLQKDNNAVTIPPSSTVPPPTEDGSQHDPTSQAS
jgi:heme/copper-type cytochrome/quinol oxidase subunit 2